MNIKSIGFFNNKIEEQDKTEKLGKIIKNYALRQNKFNKAQEANMEIEKLIDKDNIKFNENKQKKLDI